MSDTDRALLDDEPDPDPLFRQPWEDDSEDSPLGPVWDDLPDETEVPTPLHRSRSARPRYIADPELLLAPLAAAQDALGRLDARAGAAPAPLRVGLIARLALREAAGWLAAQHAWVHPSDLALRSNNLAGRLDTAAQIGRPHSALPNTLAERPTAWADPADHSAITAERALLRALALARLLTALPRSHEPLTSAETAAATLGALGGTDLDPDRFAAWQAAIRPAAACGNAGNPASALPPLLAAAAAAGSWMESGTMDKPDALVALAITALCLARSDILRTVPLPFWTAWPTLGQLDDSSALPRLRPAVARPGGADRAPWPVVFLTFVNEAARAGLRELGRLEAAAAAGEKLAAGLDRRARLPAAVELLLAQPVVTPRGLAESLGITLQAANRVLGRVVKSGIVREVTGRGSFRAFGV